MRSSKRFAVLAMTASLALVAAACGSDDDESGASSPATGASTPASGTCEAGTPAPTPLPSSTADGSADTIGLLFDVTGRGDKSFNDSAAAGLDKAKTDMKVKGEESTPVAADNSDRPDRFKQVADGAAGLVIGVGFLWEGALEGGIKRYPAKSFAVVDAVLADDNGTPDNAADDKPLPNTRSIVFAEEQGSFLVGVAAACASKSGHIGYIGGVEIPSIQKFEAGYIAGAKSIKPDIKIERKYLTQPPDFTGFNDAAKGKSTAKAMYDAGVDVIFHAAGGSGKGLFEAAKEAGAPGTVWAIGVDSDQYNAVSDDLKPYILTSMLKRVDFAVYEAIDSFVADGKLDSATVVYDLSSGGIYYASSNPEINKYAGSMEKAKADIIAGKVTVPVDPTKA